MTNILPPHGWLSGPMLPEPAAEPLGLSDRQRALFWLVRAEVRSIDDQLMLVPVLGRQLRCTDADMIAVHEALLD
jgi:hypothetical protein